MKWVVFVIVWLACFAPGAWAEEKTRIEVTVNAISGGSYYLDKGRGDGLEVGDRVTVFPISAVSVEGTIRAVSKNSARFDLDPGAAAVAIGDRGEVLVPPERIAPPPKPAPAPTPAPVVAPPTKPVIPPVAPSQTPAQPSAQAPVPNAPVDHPVWTHPPEEWRKDQPLLAPAFGLKPEEREQRIRGRAWLQSQYTRDSEFSTRTFTNSSLGVDATMENAFGHGGELRVNAVVWSRSFDVPEENLDETESKLRINRLAYTVGGTEDSPSRWTFGRFLQTGFSEFGLLDGAEWNRRISRRDEIGVSVGAMPQPYSALSSFDDYQIGTFYRHALDDERRNSLGIGYQNTWHKGDQDRNLFVGDARLQPGRDVTIRSTAWLDVYGSEDTIKDSTIELTEFLAALSWRVTPKSGLGLTLSHRKIPELLRSEFQATSADYVRDSKFERIAVNGWTSLTAKIRLDGRLDHWRDQSDSGTAGEAGASFRDLVWDQGEIRTSVFYSDGTYSSGPGFRISGSRSFGRTTANLGYEYIGFDQKDVNGVSDTLAQHMLYGALDLPVFTDWDLSLTGDKRFGDQLDSWSLGIMLQTRF